MQLNLIEPKHLAFLKENFDIEQERFEEICNEDGDELDELVDELLWKECDAAEEYERTGKYTEEGLCAIELIDIICGPYDEEEINRILSE